MKSNDFELAQKLEGLLTVQIIQSRLGVSRARAIYLVHRLRKKGFVITNYDSKKKRVYNISTKNALGGTSYIDILNKTSPIKLAVAEEHRVYGRELSAEETLVHAINQGSIRQIIACLGLFRKIEDWVSLYRFAKKEGAIRKVAALYEISRKVMAKLRKMPKRFVTLATPNEKDKKEYIVLGHSSRDFKDVENRWKVYIPLNYEDIREYKRGGVA